MLRKGRDNEIANRYEKLASCQNVPCQKMIPGYLYFSGWIINCMQTMMDRNNSRGMFSFTGSTDSLTYNFTNCYHISKQVRNILFFTSRIPGDLILFISNTNKYIDCSTLFYVCF